MNKYKVSIIIASFNNFMLLKSCLNSLENCTQGISYEVIIIDNNSDEGTLNYLRSIKRTNYTTIYNKENLGFAKANNQGIKIAVGDYLVLLNNDTEVTNNWLDELIAVAESEEQIGIVGSLLFYPDGRHIQHAGVRVAINNTNNLCPHHIYQYEHIDDIFEEIKTEQFQAVTGACMLIKSDTINKVGLLDEGFINGYEDVDFCFRANRNGLKVFLAHKSRVYHYESMSFSRNDNEELNQNLLNEKWATIIKPDRIWVSFCCDQNDIKQKLIRNAITNNQSYWKSKSITAFGKKCTERLESLAKFYITKQLLYGIMPFEGKSLKATTQKDKNSLTLSQPIKAHSDAQTLDHSLSIGKSRIKDNSWTPLLCAVFFRCSEIVQELISKGVDVNEKGRRGVTPLHKSTVFEGSVRANNKTNGIIELLIGNGADLNAVDEDGLTPLMYAVLGGSKEVAKLLISEGANLNAKDDDGETVLHYAASFGQNEIFELLIDNGADLNVKDNLGRIPLDSVDDGCKCTDFLRKNGAMEGCMRMQP